MGDLEVYALSNRCPEIMAIDSEANGLKYILDNDRKGIIISGQKGKTGLSKTQFIALCREVCGIASQYFGVTV